MLTHERLVETVASRARLGDADEATHVARTVLADLALRLSMPERRRLRQALPPADRDAAYATVPPRHDGPTEFFRDLGAHLRIPPERARYLAATVLSTLGRSDPHLAEYLAGHLPEGFSELFAGPAPDPARRHPGTSPPAPLTASELRKALRARPEWSGSTHHIERTVRLPPDRVHPLLHRIALATRGIPGRVEHHVSGGQITFTLRTRGAGAVTDNDLRLADAIDAAVDSFGSGG
ncbi:DUF2267 domain-containing protein [Streptomyces sp. 7-21]|uniref:DUF2267 domain-containing protein n=1 Tax=Streptomyces sp. 7-21 TaxID=2802283 RepID=UPI00191E4796|nr:DUF2267 domain-containing protein [Streptomyces sp. 7-21]MBL1068725.1 DUF2267 domain-containing protein [Streptomyces sp. 7-21]